MSKQVITNTTNTEMPSSGSPRTSGSMKSNRDGKEVYQTLDNFDSLLRTSGTIGIFSLVLLKIWMKELIEIASRIIHVFLVDQLFEGKLTAVFCVCIIVRRAFICFVPNILVNCVSSCMEEYLQAKQQRGIRCFLTYGFLVWFVINFIICGILLGCQSYFISVFLLPSQERYFKQYMTFQLSSFFCSSSLYEVIKLLLQIEERYDAQIALDISVTLVNFISLTVLLFSDQIAKQLTDDNKFLVICIIEMVSRSIPTLYYFSSYLQSCKKIHDLHPLKIDISFFKPFRFIAIRRILIKFPKYFTHAFIDIFPFMFLLIAFKFLAEYSEAQYENYQISTCMYFLYGRFGNSMNTALLSIMSRFYIACIGSKVRLISFQLCVFCTVFNCIFNVIWFITIDVVNKGIFNYADEYFLENIAPIKFSVIRGAIDAAATISLAYTSATNRKGLQAYLQCFQLIVMFGVLCLGLISKETNHLYSLPLIEFTNGISGIMVLILCGKQMSAVTIIKAPVVQQLIKKMADRQSSSSGVSELKLTKVDNPADSGLLTKDPDDDLLPPFEDQMLNANLVMFDTAQQNDVPLELLFQDPGEQELNIDDIF